MRPRIAVAVANAPHAVTITWSDGAQATMDLSHLIARDGVFTVLGDPDWFVWAMRMMPAGIGLAWPEGPDFSADALRQDACRHEETGASTLPVAAA